MIGVMTRARALLRWTIGLAAIAALVRTVPASAQSGSANTRKFEIVDNSFLVEESFNQEPGVFQNIFTWTRARGGDWQASFTEEWPLRGMTHQLSFTVPFGRAGDAAGFGDALLNYRYQLWAETARRPAISPRVTLVLPTGSESRGLGTGSAGIQINVPASKQFGNLYVHGNAGGTWIHGSDWTTVLAGSGIVRVREMVHVMLEAVAVPGNSTTVSPGVRGGWNIGQRQIVIGAAVPITRADGRSTAALLTYFSYEAPIR
jgi:hypothetical protein